MKIHVIVFPADSESFIKKFEFKDENLVEQFVEDMLAKYGADTKIMYRAGYQYPLLINRVQLSG